MSGDSLGLIPYGRQEITDEDVAEVARALRSDYLTQGPRVKEFETQFAQYVDAPYAVATNNATTALHLCTLVLGVKPGSRVITSPNTFVASGNCVLYAGGEVEFSDIDPITYNLDPNRVEDLIRKNPSRYSGIIPVDYAGLPCDIAAFREIATRYNLFVIEDGCHSPGAGFWKGNEFQRVGNSRFANACVFSFHPVKHIACGEGGMITTRDEKLYQQLLLLRSHGITKDPTKMREVDGPWDMEMQELGYNYRIPDILCALGISQLRRASESLKKRQKIAFHYIEALKHIPEVRLPVTPKGSNHAYHLFVIRVPNRKDLYEFLRSKGVLAQVHYIPIHQQPYYLERYGRQSFLEAELHYQQCISLPMFPSMTDNEQTRVIEAICEFYR